MIKRGVTRLGRFAHAALAREASRKGWYPFSYVMLEELNKRYTSEDDPLLERLYSSILAGENVFKITKGARFPELDERIANELGERSIEGGELTVHDLAVSNGITTLELFDRLESIPNVRVIGSDMYDLLVIVRPSDSGWTFVFDKFGKCLQICGFGLVMSGWRKEPMRYPLNRLIQKYVWKYRVNGANRLLEMPGDKSVTRIPLFHPKALQVAASCNRLSFVALDIFSSFGFSADVVRAMNVLSERHFSKEKVKIGIERAMEATKRGGLFILGRSIDEEYGQARATAYRKNSIGTIEQAWCVNGGYEHEDLVESLGESAPYREGSTSGS